MRTKPYSPMMWRIEIGRYVLHKLACAGLAYFTLMLLLNVLHSFVLDNHNEPLIILPLSPEQWIYGYIMIATILGDIIYSKFHTLLKMSLAFLYTILGFLTGFFLFINEVVGHPWLIGVMGMGSILLFYASTIAIPRESLATPLMAWLIPIITWVLL
ncbi:hypothetical protein [Paenibacillus sp. DS2015]|uniref:hypothetical protein n=1 Tax=Paenibacillus sp. DS2015 TaxID=3373917 RepID=UPI003D215872